MTVLLCEWLSRDLQCPVCRELALGRPANTGDDDRGWWSTCSVCGSTTSRRVDPDAFYSGLLPDADVPVTQTVEATRLGKTIVELREALRRIDDLECQLKEREEAMPHRRAIALDRLSIGRMR